MILYDAGLQADSKPPSKNLIKQKKGKEGMTPAKYEVELQRMQDIPRSHFLLILPERTPAHTPRVE